jgi:hypothetical protein
MTVVIHIPLQIGREKLLGPSSKRKAKSWLKKNGFEKMSWGDLWLPGSKQENYLHPLGIVGQISHSTYTTLVEVEPLEKFRTCDRKGKTHRKKKR